ncbi:MAG: 30S ribosome-binding factor RbfA [Candidatus Latescibacteria bacterium]|nr:30S ribosome-binding factor RbfA [Candidatus Latescibacterota bacterium]OPX25184.1 MAG: ribosome-binding factor A [Candidatus Latescibacteria bacterium 4484_107]
MEYKRADRVSGVLQEEISLLVRKLKDPRIGFVTITGVDVTIDLRYAKVYVSVMGDDETVRAQTLEGLYSAAGFIRRELGRVLSLRRIPEIAFRYDESVERGARIDALLNSLHD